MPLLLASAVAMAEAAFVLQPTVYTHALRAARPAQGRLRTLRGHRAPRMCQNALADELCSSPDQGRAAHDRAAELFSGPVSERPWGALFTAMATSQTFRQKMWAKQPFVVEAEAAGTAGSSFVTRSFVMDDVAEFIGQYPSQYAAQGALSPDGKGGWYMKKVGVGQDAMMTFADVEESLTKGTVVLNSAGAYLTPLAAISLATLESFQLPVGLNVYITAPGMTVSAPPHTDKQDVFVLQTQGSKHWRVFAPPAPSNKPAADPYARGKGPDDFAVADLQEPLIETNLKPGQLLYIPAGFPHTTDTLQGGDSGDCASVHLTIGLDTHIWGLDYSFLREVALRRQKQKTLFHVGGADRDVTSLAHEVYFGLMEPLPLGFLSVELLAAEEGAQGSRADRGDAALKEIVEGMALGLAGKMKAAEPERFSEAAEALVETLELREVCMQSVLHYRKVMEVQRRMYLDGKHAITPSPNSLVRVQHYMSLLDNVMQQMLGWSMGGADAGAATATVSAPAAAAAGAAGGSSGKGKGMGMGMGGSKGGKKGKKK